MNSKGMRTMTLVLFVMFVVALSLALVAGTRMYSSIATASGSVSEHRVANGAIVNTIRSMDSWDALTVRQVDDETRALVMRENTSAGVFENRIYLHDGDVIVEFAQASDGFDPDRGVKLVSTDTFDFDIDGSLVSVTTDEGTTNVTLKSGEKREALL